MRRLAATAAVAILVLIAAGCGGGDSTSASTSTATTTTSTPVPAGGEVTETSATPSLPEMPTPTFTLRPGTVKDRATGAPAPKSKGANAAPGNTVTGVYDASQAAYQSYVNWLLYEFQDSADGQRDVETVYQHGITIVCAGRALGELPDDIAYKLKANYGYSGTAAASIVKAALMALCPHRNTGYMTYLDNNAQTFYTRIVTERRITYRQFVPNVYEFGAYMKDVCSYVQSYGGTTVFNHFAQLPNTQYAVTRGGVSEDVLRLYLKYAVQSGCYGLLLQLPPVIQTMP